MDGGKSEHAPVVDRGHYKRNKKTAWLEFLEALKAWLWAHKDGQARWTLEVDEATRLASPLHPTNSAAGQAKQVLHQSILKNAILRSFQAYHPDIISMHPNTNELDAHGNVKPFGTNLLQALSSEFSPEDADGISQATLELQRALEQFPGLTKGLGALHGWCQRIQILFHDLARLSEGTIDPHTCSQIDRILTRFDSEAKEALQWYRLKDKVHALPEYIATPKVALYLTQIRRFGQAFIDAQKLGARKSGKHSTSVFSAAALCWICGGTGHDAKQCKMLETALRDYRHKHLHSSSGKPSSFSKPRHGHQGPGFQAARGHKDGKKPYNGARPARFTFKPKQDKPFKHKSRGINHGTQAGNAVHFAATSSIADLPPPQPQDTQHFAFHAACCAGHEDAFGGVLKRKHNDTTNDAEGMEDCRERADALEYTLQHAAAFERIHDIQHATGVNYEKVPPAKRRRLIPPALARIEDGLIAPALASLNDGSQKEDFDSSDGSSSDGSEGERIAQAVIARGIDGSDALTVSFDSDSSSDSDCASAKMEPTTVVKTCIKPSQSFTEQENLSASYVCSALYSDKYIQPVPGLDVYDSIKAFYPFPNAIIEVCTGPKNDLQEIKMPMPPDPVLIQDHPYSYFLQEAQRELTATKCFQVFEDGEHGLNVDLLHRHTLVLAKILAFLDDPCCASWSNDKETSPAVLKQLITIGHEAAADTLLMHQIRIYMHAYLEEIHDDLSVNYITRAVFQIPDLSTIGKDFGKTWITVNFIRDEAGLRFISSKTTEPVISLPPWDYIDDPVVNVLYPPADIKFKAPALDTYADQLNSHALAHEDSALSTQPSTQTLAHAESALAGRAYSPTAPIVCD